MAEIKVITSYPCCGKKAYFTFNPSIPQERYERICKCCGVAYQVTRRVLINKPEMLVTKWEWLDKADNEYYKRYAQVKLVQEA